MADRSGAMGYAQAAVTAVCGAHEAAKTKQIAHRGKLTKAEEGRKPTIDWLAPGRGAVIEIQRIRGGAVNGGS
jgi:hypothetical protein